MTPMGVWISLMSAIGGRTGVVNLTKRLERPQPRIEIVIVTPHLCRSNSRIIEWFIKYQN